MRDQQGIDRYGTVGKLDDGRMFVRFQRHLPYALDIVWAALTEQDQREAWFPGVRFERRQGGSFSIWFGGDCDGPSHVSGIVGAFDPPTVLQLGTIRWALTATNSGCLLDFSDVLVFQPPRRDGEIANSVLGGWHNSLDMLEDALAGRLVDPNQPEPDYASREVPGRPD